MFLYLSVVVVCLNIFYVHHMFTRKRLEDELLLFFLFEGVAQAAPSIVSH